MNKTLYFILSFILVSNIAFAQNFKSQYLDLLNKGDYKALVDHLAAWEKSDPKDPELFIAYFNYYINRDAKDAMVFNKDESGRSEGTLSGKMFYNKADVMKGVGYLDRGLKLHPERLDMHIGKIHILGEIEEYEKQKNHILAVIELIPDFSKKWLWRDGKKCPECVENLQSDIQQRIYRYFEIDTKKSYGFIKEISDRMIKLHPDKVWWYNDLASVHIKDNDYAGALQLFQAAEKIDGKDAIVLNNIAYLYELLNDKANAVVYYRKLKAAGNPELKAKAEKKIIDLQKQ